MPADENQLPTGLDWADGINSQYGTPNYSGAIKVMASGGVTSIDDVEVEELPGYPVSENAEQNTTTHKFLMPYNTAKTRFAGLARGTVLYDSNDEIHIVISSMIERDIKPGMAILTIVSEGTVDNLPDQFDITPVELGVSIIKHPRYLWALEGADANEAAKNQMVIRLLQDYFEVTTPPSRNWIVKLLLASMDDLDGTGTTQPPERPATGTEVTSHVSGTNIAKRAALEIIQKYWRNTETPYIVGWQIVWTTFHFQPQYLNPGGYVEDPITEAVPQLPDYHWSPTAPGEATSESNTIFSNLAIYNPQSYGENGLFDGDVQISWLRKADQLEDNRLIFKLTRTWIGSVVGFWDAELNTANDGPQTEDDFLVITPSS